MCSARTNTATGTLVEAPSVTTTVGVVVCQMTLDAGQGVQLKVEVFDTERIEQAVLLRQDDHVTVIGTLVRVTLVADVIILTHRIIVQPCSRREKAVFVPVDGSDVPF